MSDKELIQKLWRVSVLHAAQCPGCECDDGCGPYDGCAIINQAADLLDWLTGEASSRPLTLEELREMDGEPYGLLITNVGASSQYVQTANGGGTPFFLFTKDGCQYEKNIEQRRLTLYRRKPEEAME